MLKPQMFTTECAKFKKTLWFGQNTYKRGSRRRPWGRPQQQSDTPLANLDKQMTSNNFS